MITPRCDKCVFHNIDNSTCSAVDTPCGTLYVYLLFRKYVTETIFHRSLRSLTVTIVSHMCLSIHIVSLRSCLRSRSAKWDTRTQFLQLAASEFFFYFRFPFFLFSRNTRKSSTDLSWKRSCCVSRYQSFHPKSLS